MYRRILTILLGKQVSPSQDDIPPRDVTLWKSDSDSDDSDDDFEVLRFPHLTDLNAFKNMLGEFEVLPDPLNDPIIPGDFGIFGIKAAHQALEDEALRETAALLKEYPAVIASPDRPP